MSFCRTKSISSLASQFTYILLFSMFLFSQRVLADNTDDMTLDQRFILEQCCSLGSYNTSREDQFVLSNPMTMIIEDFSKNFNAVDIKNIIYFVNEVAVIAGIHIDVNPEQTAHISFASKLGVMILPSKKQALTNDDVASLQGQFKFLDGSAAPSDALEGIQGIIDEIYKKDAYVIAHVRGFKNNKVAYAIMFIKPSIDICHRLWSKSVSLRVWASM